MYRGLTGGCFEVFNLTYIILLLIAGVLLAFLETFIPSGGLLVVLAVLSLLAAVMLGFAQSAATGSVVLIVELVSVPVLVIVGLKMLPRTPFGRKMLLTAPGDDFGKSRGQAGVSEEDYSHLLGKTGIVMASLRPSGIVEIDGVRYSVAAEGELIEQGCEVVVVKVEGNNVIVEPKERREQA